MNRVPPLTAAALALALLPLSAPRAQFVYGFTPLPAISDESWQAYGHAVAFLGDLNGDGRAEFVVAEERWPVYIHDGASRAVLRTIPRPDGVAGLVEALLAVGDVTADGIPDFVVAARYPDFGVLVIDGASGAVVRTLVPTESGGLLTSALAAGDVDGDGAQDIAVGAPEEFGGAVLSGRVHVFSGATGALIRTLVSPNAAFEGNFGYTLDFLGDLDSDGVTDLLVGAPGESLGNGDFGRAYAFSGATGALIRTFASLRPGRFGTRAVGVGDVDGDGAPDFAAGMVGQTLIVSGATGGVLRELPVAAGLLVTVGDNDGDGVKDLAVVLPPGFDRAGPVHVYTLFSGALLHVLRDPGDANGLNGTRFGRAVAGGGDTDGDGIGELLVGAPGYDTRVMGNPRPDVGRAYLYALRQAPPHRRDLGSPTPSASGSFGAPLAFVGDVDGDGGSDFVVSGDIVSSRAVLYLFAGATGTVLRSLPDPSGLASSGFGSSVAPAGDVDGDGVPDVLVGSPSLNDPAVGTGVGRAYVLSGASGTPLRTLHSPGPQANGQFGFDVAGGVDVSGDGVPDVMIGSQESVLLLRDGRVHVLSGATGGPLYALVSPGSTASGGFGRTLAFVGDMNGDGVPDLAVGARGEGADGAGRAYVFSGATGALIRPLASPNPQSGGLFGSRVSPAGDFNGDGVQDLAVSAQGETVDASRNGRVYVFSGADGLLLRTFEGPLGHGGRLGRLAAVGDVNGDGIADLLVGANNASTGPNGMQDTGEAYLFSGASGDTLRTFRSPFPEAGGGFGLAVAFGDANGDGVGDVLVGAPNEGTYVPGGHAYLYYLGEDIVVSAPPPAAPSGAPTALDIEAVWPSPARASVRVRYAAPVAAPVRIAVYDLLGRRVLTHEEGVRSVGLHEAALDLSGLQAGIYALRVEGVGTAVRRLVVVR